MPENEFIEHHDADEAELGRLENQLDKGSDRSATEPKKRFIWILTAVIVGLIVIVGGLMLAAWLFAR